jgi:hypothetical protein
MVLFKPIAVRTSNPTFKILSAHLLLLSLGFSDSLFTFYMYFTLQIDPNDQNGPDLETKIEELRLGIRRSEVSRQGAYPVHKGRQPLTFGK